MEWTRHRNENNNNKKKKTELQKTYTKCKIFYLERVGFTLKTIQILKREIFA